eukprot:8549720-Pyramimonas_sp.AAC.1
MATPPDGGPAPRGARRLKKNGIWLGDSGIGGDTTTGADCGGHVEPNPHGAPTPSAELDGMQVELGNCTLAGGAASIATRAQTPLAQSRPC